MENHSRIFLHPQHIDIYSRVEIEHECLHTLFKQVKLKKNSRIIMTSYKLLKIIYELPTD